MRQHEFGLGQKRYGTLILVLGSIIASGAGNFALGASEGTELEEVIVSAQKRDTDLQKTPISMQVYSGETLTEEGKKRIDDIMRGIVGVASQGSQVGTSFFMRGIGIASGPQIAGTSQSAVSVLIDGVYQNRGETVRGGTLDVAQVEVMRGTQSTTIGAASLAGAVSLVSKDPVFEREGTATLEVGSYNLTSMEGVINLPLSDKQAFRLAYSQTKRDGYLSSGAGDSDLTNYRVKYRWKPSENFDMVLSGGRNRIGGNGVDASVLTYYGFWEPYVAAKDRQRGGTCTTNCYDVTMSTLFGHVNNGQTYRDRSDAFDDGYPADIWPNSPYRDTTVNQYSADLRWHMPHATLSVKPSYQKADFLSDEPPRGTDWRGEARHQKTTQLDVQLTSASNQKLEWLGGLYFYDTELNGDFRSTGLPGFGAGPGCPSASATQNTYCWAYDDNTHKSYSAYVNGNYSFTDKLKLEAGLRYSKDKKTFLSNPDSPGTIAGVGPAGYGGRASNSRDWSETTYRVGLDYNLTEQSMAYLMYSTGYQAGQLGGPYFNGTPAETLGQITAGLKSRWMDGRLQFNIEAFRSTYHDRVLDGSVSVEQNAQFAPPFPACSDFPVPTSAFYDPGSGYLCYLVLGATVPNLYSQGVDLELNWLLSENDRIDFTLERLDSTTTSPNGVPTAAAFTQALAAVGFTGSTAALYTSLTNLASSFDGLVLQNSPEWSGNLTYGHTFRMTGGSSLTVQGNWEYKTKYWSLGGAPGANIANPGLSYQDGASQFNAYASWSSSDHDWSVNGYVRNIGDKAIQTNFSPPFGGAATYVTLAPPRTFGVSVSAHF
jgi:iron complex outermembrane recepter protein